MLKRIDHVGVLVDDLSEAKRFLAQTLGLEHDRDLDASALGRMAAFYRCGETQIEVIEDQDPSAKARNLAGARARIDHIAIQVEGLTDTVAALEGLGVKIARGPAELDGRRSVWTDPESCDGVGYQLLEPL